jgi:hypothetical protein
VLLSGVAVTDEGLGRLAGLPSLRRIHLDRLGGVTPEAVGKFGLDVAVSYEPAPTRRRSG